LRDAGGQEQRDPLGSRQRPAQGSCAGVGTGLDRGFQYCQHVRAARPRDRPAPSISLRRAHRPRPARAPAAEVDVAADPVFAVYQSRKYLPLRLERISWSARGVAQSACGSRTRRSG
jgi:hypothetical protein